MRNAGDDPATAFKTGDTVEIFISVNDKPLDARRLRGEGMDTAREGDYRVLMTLLRDAKPVVFGYDFVHPGGGCQPMDVKVSGPRALIDCAGVVPGAEMAAADATIGETAGFIVEAKLPWKYFRGYRPKPGARLLFNLAVNFSNGAGTANIGKAYWNGPSHMCTDLGIESQIHPEGWGWVELMNDE
ncbi:MAG TPA: hypothetical protein VM223_02160 [Planctomycetota bacterium]|nr:hypothetical protein [Planctomycetota bacterium]